MLKQESRGEIKLKIYDKAAWHIDNGMAPEKVIKHFETVFSWLEEKGFLNDSGKEIIEIGIGSDASIHEELLTPDGNEFLSKYYDDIIKKTEYSTDKTIVLLNKYFNS
jgi:hypothetical protein